MRSSWLQRALEEEASDSGSHSRDYIYTQLFLASFKRRQSAAYSLRELRERERKNETGPCAWPLFNAFSLGACWQNKRGRGGGGVGWGWGVGGVLRVGVPTPNLPLHARAACWKNWGGNFRWTRRPCELRHLEGMPLFLCDMVSCL